MPRGLWRQALGRTRRRRSVISTPSRRRRRRRRISCLWKRGARLAELENTASAGSILLFEFEHDSVAVRASLGSRASKFALSVCKQGRIWAGTIVSTGKRVQHLKSTIGGELE